MFCTISALNFYTSFQLEKQHSVCYFIVRKGDTNVQVMKTQSATGNSLRQLMAVDLANEIANAK